MRPETITQGALIYGRSVTSLTLGLYRHPWAAEPLCTACVFSPGPHANAWRFRSSRCGIIQPITMAQTGEPAVGDISMLLRAWSDGDQKALARLTPIVYDELHRLADRYMKRERRGHSLQTTALVNEAYVRLVDYKRMQWQNRAHFFAVSAQLMRRILVERARRHNLKRGGGVQHVSLEEAPMVGGNRAADLVALDDAMNALARLDPRKTQ